MKSMTMTESTAFIGKFLKRLKSDTSKGTGKIEYFELTLQEPIYEKLNCAYIQTASKKEAILYEALTNRYFLISQGKGSEPAISTLTKSIGTLIPKEMKDKMFWVCGNKKDKSLSLSDFGSSFSISKPSNP